METLILGGYGARSKLTVDEDMLRNSEDDASGKLLRVFPLSGGEGGIIFNSLKPGGGMEGILAEYENAFVCIQSDGEYIDICWFLKEGAEEFA